jgi:hypothetical protein
MTHPDLAQWLTELDQCPASAVEQPLMQKLYQQNPLFFTALSLRQRWQLLVGLHMALLDYTSASFSPLELDAQFLSLPVRHRTIPLAQLLDALVIAGFNLDQVAWSEELDPELSEQEEAACDQVLTSQESAVLLQQLISRGLAFLAACDLREAGHTFS